MEKHKAGYLHPPTFLERERDEREKREREREAHRRLNGDGMCTNGRQRGTRRKQTSKAGSDEKQSNASLDVQRRLPPEGAKRTAEENKEKRHDSQKWPPTSVGGSPLI